MRPYETLIILSNELGGEMPGLVDRFSGLIRDNGGQFEANHDWGSRRLAYPIKKQGEAHYYLFEYSAEPAVVSELERTLRITDGVLRYLSVQQEHTGLPQARPRETSAREDVPHHELRSMRTERPGPKADQPAAETRSGDESAPPATEAAATPAPREPSPGPAAEAGADAESDGVKSND